MNKHAVSNETIKSMEIINNSLPHTDRQVRTELTGG